MCHTIQHMHSREMQQRHAVEAQFVILIEPMQWLSANSWQDGP